MLIIVARMSVTEDTPLRPDPEGLAALAKAHRQWAFLREQVEPGERYAEQRPAAVKPQGRKKSIA